VLATLATSRTNHLLDAGEPGPVALAGGYHLAFGIAAAILLAAVVLAATVLRPPQVAAEPSLVIDEVAAEADAA
jgi:hypothetical protein